MIRPAILLSATLALAGCLSLGGDEPPTAPADGGPQPPAVPVPEVETEPLPPQ